ncbi:MAG: hypothetical protein K8T90_04075 [Planctomycetes bacterium]|nr:hypothetical protein [Planctomycetota bacterium]
MQGEHVPIVFFPRFSTFAGAAGKYYTQPVDMLGFETASITVFRGMITGGGGPTVAFEFEQSTDLIEWESMGPPFDPSSAGNVPATQQVGLPIARRYVRLYVVLGGADPVITLFAIGWAARTEQ